MITERRKEVLCLLCVLILMGNAILTLNAGTYGKNNSEVGSGDKSIRFSPTPSTYAVNGSGNPSYSEGSLSSGSYNDTRIQDGQYQVSQSSTHTVNQQSIMEYCNGAQDSRQVGSIPWSSPSNAQGTDDGLYATATCPPSSAGVTHYLACQNFGFNIPTGYSIIGIVVQIYRHADLDRHSFGNDYVRDQSVCLVIDSSPVGVDKGDNSHWGTSDVWASYGSSSDGWGANLQASNVSTSGFGVALSAAYYDNLGDGNIAYVDAIRINVFYALVSYKIDFNYDFQFKAADHAWIQSITLSTTGKTSTSSVDLSLWNYINSTWDRINHAYTTSESTITGVAVAHTNNGPLYVNMEGPITVHVQYVATPIGFAITSPRDQQTFTTGNKGGCFCAVLCTAHSNTNASISNVTILVDGGLPWQQKCLATHGTGDQWYASFWLCAGPPTLPPFWHHIYAKATNTQGSYAETSIGVYVQYIDPNRN